MKRRIWAGGRDQHASPPRDASAPPSEAVASEGCAAATGEGGNSTLAKLMHMHTSPLRCKLCTVVHNTLIVRETSCYY